MYKNDPIGNAVQDFFKTGKYGTLIVHSDLCDDDEIPVPYLFRTFDEMPPLEQKALQLCKGKILDVGAGAGSHSLYLQQQGFDVTALELSQGCVDVMEQRGIKKVKAENFYYLGGETYDTILLLMNGTGFAGKLKQFPNFLNQFKKLLNPGGQVIFDTSDIVYLFENEDGSIDINLNSEYYGEMNYCFEYKGKQGDWFPWLYVDKEKLSEECCANGWNLEIVSEGEHYDYLAKLTLNTI